MSETPKVLVTHPLIEDGLELLERHYDVIVGDGLEGEALADAVRDVAALVPLLSVRVDEPLLQRAPELRIVANYAVGFDNVDLDAAARRRVWVTNTPGVLTEATADLAWSALLGVVRRVVAGHRMMASGSYDGWGATMLLGVDLYGKTLGIVGLGKIGRATARRAAGFGMRVVFHDSSTTGEVDLDGLVTASSAGLDELLQLADFVSLHTPLTAETHHLIDARRLALMKPTAYLVNTSRGPVVDEAALVAHLRAGRIAGAALDVYEREPAMAPGLAELDNVLLLPHIGSATRETRTAMARTVAANVHAVLQGHDPPNPVVRV